MWVPLPLGFPSGISRNRSKLVAGQELTWNKKDENDKDDDYSFILVTYIAVFQVFDTDSVLFALNIEKTSHLILFQLFGHLDINDRRIQQVGVRVRIPFRRKHLNLVILCLRHRSYPYKIECSRYFQCQRITPTRPILSLAFWQTFSLSCSHFFFPILILSVYPLHIPSVIAYD